MFKWLRRKEETETPEMSTPGAFKEVSNVKGRRVAIWASQLRAHMVIEIKGHLVWFVRCRG